MTLILPGAFIGGKMKSKLLYVGQTTAGVVVNSATHTISGLDFGPAVRGANQKWAALLLIVAGDDTVSLSATFGGVAGSIIYQQSLQTVFGSYAKLAALAARVDTLTVGDVTWTDDTTAQVWASVVCGINIDMSSVVDSDYGTNVANVPLAVDSVSGGAVISYSYYGFSSGAPTAVGNTNLSLMQSTSHPLGAGVGHVLSGNRIDAGQAALNVSTSYSPASANASAFALSFAGI